MNFSHFLQIIEKFIAPIYDIHDHIQALNQTDITPLIYGQKQPAGACLLL